MCLLNRYSITIFAEKKKKILAGAFVCLLCLHGKRRRVRKCDIYEEEKMKETVTGMEINYGEDEREREKEGKERRRRKRRERGLTTYVRTLYSSQG